MMRIARYKTAALVAGTCLALAGCGGGGATGQAQNDTGAAVEDVDRDAHLRVGHTVPAPPLNPHTTTSTLAIYPYVTPVYDRLTQIRDNDGVMELAPMVATGWEFSEDGRRVDFTLREGVTFSDGAPLDAEAVKATFDHAMAEGSTAAPFFSMVELVQVVDPLTVRFVTNRPAADLPYVVANAEGSLISPQALDNPDLDVNPVGSGPYVVTEMNVGDSVTYERREGYWDPDAQLAKTVTIQGITDDNARLNALRSGQLDLILSKVSMYNQASNLGDGFGFFSYGPSQVYSVYLNHNRPAVQDPAVRQALNFAVDREGISSSLLQGQCSPNGQVIPEGMGGYLDDPPVDYTLDQERARELLAAAGAESLELDLLVPAGLSPHVEIAEALQAQFAEVGVQATLSPMDLVEVNGAYGSGEADGLVQLRLSEATPAQSLATAFGNKRLFPGELPDGFLETLAPAFDPSTPEAEREAAVEEVNAISVEEAFDVWVCGVATQYAFADDVIGVDDMGISHFSGVPDLRYVGLAGEG